MVRMKYVGLCGMGCAWDGAVNAGRAAEFGRDHFDKPAFAVARIVRHTAVAPEIDKRLPSLGGHRGTEVSRAWFAGGRRAPFRR